MYFYLCCMRGVDKTISFVHYWEMLDRGLQEIPSEEKRLSNASLEDQKTFWENPSQLAEVMQLVYLNANNISGVVNHPDYSRTNIVVRTTLSRASDVATTVEKIRSFAQKTF